MVVNSARVGMLHQAEIGQHADERTENEPGEAAERHAPSAVVAADQNAIEEQHDLAALAQHGDADHDRERQQRFGALHDRLSRPPHNSPASSVPWRAIQTLCQVSITTATAKDRRR